MVLHENVPSELFDEMKKTVAEYTQEGQNNDITAVIEKTIFEEQIKALTIAKQNYKEKLEKEEE